LLPVPDWIQIQDLQNTIGSRLEKSESEHL